MAAPQPVPWRTIVATVAVVGGALLGVVLVVHLARIIAWLVVAGFFAVILSPGVDWLERRFRLRRGLATAIVFISVLLLLALMLWAFITPVVHEVQKFIDDLPRIVSDARHGKGPIGDIVKRYDLDKKLDENQDKIR